MPIWLSLTLALVTGVGAYMLAPAINQEFQYQRNRADHVTRTVNGVSTDFAALAKEVRLFNHALFYREKDLSKRRSALLDRITELQWSLIDVSAVINRERGEDDATDDLQKSLTKLYEHVQNANDPVDQELVIASATEAARDARKVLVNLYEAAHLS